MYIYLNTFISGCSGGLSIGSLLVGSQQDGPECSSSTASIVIFIFILSKNNGFIISIIPLAPVSLAPVSVLSQSVRIECQ